MGIRCPRCQAENPSDSKFCKECATALTPAADVSAFPTQTMEAARQDLTTGTIFAGRYQIVEELGGGGMGKVYRAHDTKVGEEIAIKLIKPEVAADKATIERFKNELKIARKIVHKSVGRVYDLNEERGTFYFTMEYVRGEDLKAFIRSSGQMAVGTTLRVARQIAEGLAEAHELGIVHRDLKPSNIMINRHGNARIMDFGIARMFKEKGITGAGIAIGTPEYMSPEQVDGKDVDQRSDIYSLGIILYEMLTGRVPFEGDTPFAVGVKQKSELPKDPKQLNAQIPDDLNRIILRCLEKDKAKRYQSVAELNIELGKMETGIPPGGQAVPLKTPLTSREITVKFDLRKLFAPGLILAVIGIVALIYFLLISKKAGAPEAAAKKSVAVLSFSDLSPAKDREYLCDGIAETLINSLSRIQGLRVPAATSAFSFKGKRADIKEIGQKLAVEAVLEGSLQIAGDRLRVTAQLISVNDGYHLWSEKYDGSVSDIFAVQDDIAQKIVEALRIKLLGETKAQVVKRYTENQEAYDLYMQGLYFYNKRGKENLEKAVEYLKRAIAIDPKYALAHAQLAETYATIGDWGQLPPREAFPRAKEAAQIALEINDSLAEARCALAQVKYVFERDWRSAEEEYKKGLSLNPSYAAGHKSYGEFLTRAGRFDEAQRAYNKASEIDPLSLIIRSQVAWPLMHSRQYDLAIEQLKSVLEMDPNFEPAQDYLRRALFSKYIAKGMYKEALEECQKSNNQMRTGIVYAKMGRKIEAQEILMNLMAQSEHNAEATLWVAQLCFALEENDQGFQWLEKAYEYKHHELSFIKIWPDFDSVRDDPRFKDMLKRVGLEK